MIIRNDESESTDEYVSIEIDEQDFSDPERRRQAVTRLTDTVSPQHFARKLVRPKISAVSTILNITIPLCVSAAVFCLLFFTVNDNKLAWALGVSLGLTAIYCLLRLRSILIWCILVYQRFAPDSTRLRCVYTPSCSEYAVAALKKYGVIRGVPKIIARLKRCHHPNGGYDPLD